MSSKKAEDWWKWAQVLRRRTENGKPAGVLGYSRSERVYSEIRAETPCASEPWYAYGRFRVHSGQLQLAALTVFPGSDRIGLTKGSPGWPEIGWSDEWRPADELTAEIIRGIPLRALRSIAIESVEKYGEGPLGVAEREALSRHPGRGGRSDYFYALWAARYAGKAGSNAPIAELARQYDVRREQVRDLVQQARKRKLLRPGRSGQLTKKAQTILSQGSD